MSFLKPNGDHFDFNTEHILGLGTIGIVLLAGTNALKIAKVRDTSELSGDELADQEYVNWTNTEILERAKGVCQRVGASCEGIARCIKISDEGILLQNYTRGDLEALHPN